MSDLCSLLKESQIRLGSLYSDTLQTFKSQREAVLEEDAAPLHRGVVLSSIHTVTPTVLDHGATTRANHGDPPVPGNLACMVGSTSTQAPGTRAPWSVVSITESLDALTELLTGKPPYPGTL